MKYSDKALVFLTSHGMAPESVGLEAATAAFLADMELGLAGRPSSLKMIPTYLTSDGALPLGRTVAVVDAGGTNFRTALVTYAQSGPVVEALSVGRMPGSVSTVSWEEFIDYTARSLLPLMERAEAVGFCFSYPAAETPEGDWAVVQMTKQVSVTGYKGRLICSDLKKRLSELGAEDKRVILLNDTPAVLLSGAGSGEYDGLVGLISGTGTNTCCAVPVSAIKKPHAPFSGTMLVNLESGGFDRLPRGELDAEMDADTADTGTYLHEKMTSGAYVGELCRRVLRRAGEEGMFSQSGNAAALGIEKLETAGADAIAAGEDASIFAPGGDAALASELCLAVFDRAARCLCANLSAILMLTDGGRSEERPACVLVDGSMYKKSRVFGPLLEGYMAGFTAERMGRHCVFRTANEATMLGSAVAALLNM